VDARIPPTASSAGAGMALVCAQILRPTQIGLAWRSHTRTLPEVTSPTLQRECGMALPARLTLTACSWRPPPTPADIIWSITGISATIPPWGGTRTAHALPLTAPARTITALLRSTILALNLLVPPKRTSRFLRTISLLYSYNVNEVYFDGIQLFKKEFGHSYNRKGGHVYYLFP